MSKIDEILARVRELHAAATPGPWTGDSAVGVIFDRRGTLLASMAEDMDGAPEPVVGDASLIAEYRTMAPRIADMLERAMIALKRVEQGEFGDWGGDVALVARAEIEVMAEGGEA